MPVPSPLAAWSRSKRASLRRRLDRLHGSFDRRYLETDPLAFVHRYSGDDDREIVGFLASALAFGNVRSIQSSVGSLLRATGDAPARFVAKFEPALGAIALEGLYHRWIRDLDLVALFAVLRRMREQSGSIGGFFMEGHDREAPDIGPSLSSFSARARALADPPPVNDPHDQGSAIREHTETARVQRAGPVRAEHGASVRGERAGPVRAEREGPARAQRAGHAGRLVRVAHGSVAPFFPSPRDGSACKRLNLYLRWMIRGDDGLDLGIWKGVPKRQLVIPLDTHLARISRALGLTKRRTPGWAMAIEATRSLALLDPEDPVKYDFALSRLGILDLCLHGRDPLECRACPPPHARIRGKG